MTDVVLQEVSGCQLDSARIVRWRNDPVNAAAFPKQEPWTLEGQQHWYYNTYRRDPQTGLYFVCLNGEAIGTVGMRIEGGQGEMMWMILGNKELARGGYMRQGMRKLMEAYGLPYYWGRVMPSNKAGLKFQLDNGFIVTGNDCEVVEDVDGNRVHMLLISRHFDGTWPTRPGKAISTQVRDANG